MKFANIKSLMLLLLLTGSLACQKEEKVAAPEGLEGDTWVKGELDKWLNDNFTVPYNIEVKYRWDPYELEVTKNMTPPREDVVIPVMETVKKVWIEPYVAEAGEAFIKTYTPKQYVLVGSAEWNSNGTITLGQAEGGRKIVLFVLNDFEKTDKAEVKRMLHTIHHEFAHILHQTIRYSDDYRSITPSGYTATWTSYTDAQSRELGFITSYSRAGVDEDFVEMISLMLIEGREGFNAIVNSIQSASAKAAIKQKEQVIVRYYKESWNMDFYSLQAKVFAAINN